MPEMIAQRDAFGETLVELGQKNPDIVVLDADLATSTKTIDFANQVPDRFFQMGIAEQNMIGVAAGMATMGFIPFTSTFACFAATRCLDQIRVVVAQPHLNVKIVGAYSGILTGKTGKTHQAVEDIAIFRAMPEMVTVAPVDGREVAQAVRAIAEYEGPVYLRLTRDACPVVVPDDYQFELGKAVKLRTGSDLAFISTGQMSSSCVEAADKLSGEGVSASVLHVPTIKPLDVGAIVAAAAETGRVLTVEDHSVIGGLGGAVAEALGEHRPTPMKRVGMQDTFAESGDNQDLLDKYGLALGHIIGAARDCLA